MDKTELIQKIIDIGSKVSLFTRPRRFGKSLNLSMLQAYFESGEQDNSYLFEGLYISELGESYKKHLGAYPVIKLDFKEGKQGSYQRAFEKLRENIVGEFRRHKVILESESLDEIEKQKYRHILSETADDGIMSSSVFFLLA